MKLPSWAAIDEQVARAGVRQAVAALPRVVRVVLGLAWVTAPGLTVLAGVVHVVSGVATTFGLLATANVFTVVLQAGPTPQRVLGALPALVIVVGSYAVRAGLDSTVSVVEGALVPRVTRAAEAEVTAAVARVRLLAFEDADFRELARQGGLNGPSSIGLCLRQIAEVAASGIALGSALVAAGLLHPLLLPALLLAAVAEGWAAARVARLRNRWFFGRVTRQMRKAVVDEAVTSRALALERHALVLQERLLAEHSRICESLMRDEVGLSHRSALVRLTGRAGAGVGSGVAYGVLGVLLYGGLLPLALAGTAVVAMRTAASALSSTMRAVNDLYEGAFYIDFYVKLLAEAADRRPLRSTVTAPEHPRQITVDNVSFTYPGQDEPALREVSLTLGQGEVIALVGENGSGKSTLAKIVTGLYPPSSGSVYWDEVNLARAEESSVHSRIAVIAQDPARWPMTAGHNILVGSLDRADPDRAWWHTALDKSGADEVVGSLPEGEHTLLSRQFSNAQDLSGGQWQRIGIARGLYRDAPILVADEPTAALDAKAEARVFAGLRHAATHGGAARITIMVTHRLANIATADRIIVMNHGLIVEQGTHEELLAAHGLYRELYDIQARPYGTTATPTLAGEHP